MRVIPVIDLMGGQVVRGVAGRRSDYRPIQSRIAADARPGTVARAFVEHFGFDTAYVADLDSIMHGCLSIPPWREIAAAGLNLWLDAGVGSQTAARLVLAGEREARIQCQLVIGLESLESPRELPAIATLCRNPPILSLDLQNGRPLTQISEWKPLSPAEIAKQVVATGIRRLIVLDLADVGLGGGTHTMQLCQDLRRQHPHIELIAGGGVRGTDDLKALSAAGCDAALVASALHDGRLSRDDVREV